MYIVYLQSKGYVIEKDRERCFAEVGSNTLHLLCYMRSFSNKFHFWEQLFCRILLQLCGEESKEVFPLLFLVNLELDPTLCY